MRKRVLILVTTALLGITALLGMMWYMSSPEPVALADANVAATDVTIIKTVSTPQVIAGDAFTYRINYSNTSGIDAASVVISDHLPYSLEYVDDDSDLSCPACTPGTTGLLTWTVGDLPAGVFASFVLTANFVSGCSLSFTNVVTIGTASVETNTGDNIAHAGPTTVLCADLTITKTRTVPRVVPGGLAPYTIAYCNDGQANAQNVRIIDSWSLSDSRWFSDTAETAGWTRVATTPKVFWTRPSLPSGDCGSFQLTVQTPATGLCDETLANGVTISTITPERFTSNNQDVADPVTITCPDLGIDKTTVSPQGPPAAPIDFTISYANQTDVAVKDVVITDRIPIDTIYLGDTGGLGCPSCVLGSTGLLTWTVPSLPPASGGSFTLTLGYRSTSCPFAVTNAVTIGSKIDDFHPADNRDTATYQVMCDVDLAVVKDDGLGSAGQRGFVYEGELVTYTISVTNAGTFTATNVVLTETLPEHTEYVGLGWGAATSRTLTQTAGDLSPAEDRTYHFVVRVHDPLPEGLNGLVNRVCGGGNQPDVSADNNCSLVDTPVRRFPLLVIKSADTCIAPGAAFNYTITYQNISTDTTYYHVGLTDTLDSHVSYIGGSGWNCQDQVCRRIIPVISPQTGHSLTMPVRLSATFPFSERMVITNVVQINAGRDFVLTSPVDNGPDLSVVKRDDVGPLPSTRRTQRPAASSSLLEATQHREFVKPGDLITYTILYSNTGQTTASQVVLTETLPEHTSYTGDGWIHISGRRFITNVGDLAPGQGGQLHFVVRLDDPFQIGVDRVTNRVEIGGRTAECDLSNNWSVDDAPVRNNVRLYVANRGSGTIDVFSTTAFEHITTVSLGGLPFGMATIDQRLIVANFGSDLLHLISLTNTTVLTSARVGHNSIHAATLGGLAFVANHSIGEGITIVDQGGHVVARMRPGLPQVYDFGFFGVTADEKRGLIYATKRDFGAQGIWALTPPSSGLVFTQVYATHEKPSSIIYHPNTDRVYVTFGLIDELWVFDPETWELLDRIPTQIQDPVDPGYGGHGLAVLRRCVFVSNYKAQSITAVINGRCVEGAVGAPPAPPPVGPYAVYLPLIHGAPQQVLVHIPIGGRPMGITAKDNRLFVTLPFENKVVVIDTETMTVENDFAVVGAEPHTVILAEDRSVAP